MTDVVSKLWDFCNYLRHDGITYGNYIEQLTYLLFLKMAKEKEIKLPENSSWDDLIKLSGTELLKKYSEILESLSEEEGMLKDIFARSRSEFSNPTNLKKLLNLIDEINWMALPVDVKGAAYEGLLEKFAAEEKGAGEYFTPRILIKTIVKCMKPDFRLSNDFTIHDPACGTGGFIIGAFEWIKGQTKGGSQLKIKDRERLLKSTLSGMDNVVMTRRLALMNCYLHSIEPTIYFGDSLGEGPHASQRYNVILTNPPFGSKGVGGAPSRDDFLFKTANKQLNFLQHVISLLKIGGQSAIVIPDNVLFESSGEKIRKHLLKICNVHTILRLPEGIFMPYAVVKANVIFFTKGSKTKDVWIYDLRSDIPIINKGNPLKEELFVDFEKCYEQNPRKKTKRFKKFSIQKIEDEDFSLDLSFLEDKVEFNEKPIDDPLDIAKEISSELQDSITELNSLIKNLKDN